MVQGTFKQLGFSVSDKKAAKAGHANRDHVSSFLITMNTNMRLSDDLAVAYAPDLAAVATRLFRDEVDIRKYVRFYRYAHGTATPDYDTTWSDDTVISYGVISSVEVGHMKTGSRLHLHVGVKIWHRSAVRLDIEAIKQAANDVLDEGGSGLKIHYIHVTAHAPTLEDYLRIDGDLLDTSVTVSPLTAVDDS